ncbi:MAG: TonB-dependent receptor [Thermoanaerobaculia bacterium]|nr:TonB-dependent receptor [Thermoanaerobaculia bacterium]
MRPEFRPFVFLSCVALLMASPLVAQDQGEMEEVEEVIIVTASRTEQELHEVPAAVSVLTAEQIEQIPADDFGDLLRNVPGMNVTQISARDVNMSTRSSTGSLETAQLVLVDGRTLYLDFFGFVMWDFMPVDPREIKQVEVVRGPGSAVWGANAMSGVVNVITKRPREMVGTSLTVGGGELGTTLAGLTVAGASDRLGWKISGGYYEQDPYDRPTGFVPGTGSPTNPQGTPYPDFENRGTEQPKVDLRLDFDQTTDTTWRFSTGYAGTDGLVHSGIGPFDINDKAEMTYFQADWNRRAAQISLYGNALDGDATNLLAVGPTGQPLQFFFESETYNLDVNNTSILGASNILTYGARLRKNEFDLSIAPGGDERDEWGVFLQDEILFGDKVRWLIGGRYDEIDPLDGVFSPRTTLLISPTPNNTLRFSYNEAFRSPSMVNNFLEIVIINQVCLAPTPAGCALPYVFPSFAGGNVNLEEERLEAIEVGWVGTFGPHTVTLAAYENTVEDGIDFFTASTYTSAMPPPNFPLPAFFLDIPPPNGLAGLLPASFSYRNTGEVTNTGVEFAWNYNPRTPASFYVNASWQDDPETEGIALEPRPNGELIVPVNVPPEIRLNVGGAYNGERWFGNLNVNYQDEAFWTDILDSRFWGPTDSFTMVNAGLGYRFGESVSLSVTGQNIFDEDVQQHVFGDILSRKVVGILRIDF